MSAPLSHTQKRYLSQLARRAWQSAERETGDADSFRHAEVIRACGKHGLRCCSQDDYKRVEAHFLWLLGEDVKAFHANLRAETEPVRTARAVLERECGRFGFQLSYPAAICRQQFHVELNSASEKQLWNLVYTIRNRGAARRQSQAA